MEQKNCNTNDLTLKMLLEHEVLTMIYRFAYTMNIYRSNIIVYLHAALRMLLCLTLILLSIDFGLLYTYDHFGFILIILGLDLAVSSVIYLITGIRAYKRR